MDLYAIPSRNRRGAPRPGMVARARAALAVALLPALVAGCGSSRHEKSHAPESAPVEVEVVTVAPPTARGSLTLPARVKAAEEVTLTAKLGARLTALRVREGDFVRTGQVLMVFDAPETRRALEAARREHEAATIARDAAVRQYARVESLYVTRVLSERDRELADGERRSAEARLESAHATLEQLDAAANVRAPFNGRVARRHVDVGADVAAGAALLDLRSSGMVEILAPIPETVIPAIDKAAFHYQVGDGPWRPARLIRLDGMTDFTTRTRDAHLLPSAGGDLEPGAFARLRIESAGLAGSATPQVPLTALVRRGGLTGVYVVEDGRAWLRWLKLGRDDGVQVEVLSGLEAGEQVARTAGGLEDGRPVKPRS
jgi:RND family efflux transporter MFP subunit